MNRCCITFEFDCFTVNAKSNIEVIQHCDCTHQLCVFSWSLTSIRKCTVNACCWFSVRFKRSDRKVRSLEHWSRRCYNLAWKVVERSLLLWFLFWELNDIIVMTFAFTSWLQCLSWLYIHFSILFSNYRKIIQNNENLSNCLIIFSSFLMNSQIHVQIIFFLISYI